MRRQIKIISIAGAAVVAGGALWAIASSDMLGHFGRSSSAPTNEASSDPRGAGGRSPTGDGVAAVPAPRMPVSGAPRRSAEAVAIEIARIDASGASVIAGRSPPNHRVIVLANGREIASATATDEGQWSVIVSEGIAAGPLELSVSAKPANGGTAVVSTPRKLVVPPSRTSSSVAEAPPAKVWAPPMAAGGPAPKSPTAVAASPAERAQSKAHAQGPVLARGPGTTVTDSTAPLPAKAQNSKDVSRAEAASDKKALEQFAALVERARTDAAAVARRDGPAASSPGTNSPGATPPSSPGATATSSSPTTTAPISTPTQAGSSSVAMRAGATDVRPDPAQVPIPVPITFVTDETELTPDGERAAALLAEYLRLKRPDGISLSGHADSRGPDGYNMDLSKRRLEAIEQYLRQAGYAGNMSLIPKGKREPYLGIDRTKLSLHEVYQADRRVELRLTK